MDILIMRHGEASYMAREDSLRPLTPRGKMQAFSQGQHLQQQGYIFDRVLVSPFLRAKETFLAVDRAFNGELKGKMHIEPMLTPDGDEALLIAYLATLKQQGVKQLLLISHLPLVATLTFLLSQGKLSPCFSPAYVANVLWETE